MVFFEGGNFEDATKKNLEKFEKLSRRFILKNTCFHVTVSLYKKLSFPSSDEDWTHLKV
jgi:hypothetical protein